MTRPPTTVPITITRKENPMDTKETETARAEALAAIARQCAVRLACAKAAGGPADTPESLALDAEAVRDVAEAYSSKDVARLRAQKARYDAMSSEALAKEMARRASAKAKDA